MERQLQTSTEQVAAELARQSHRQDRMLELMMTDMRHGGKRMRCEAELEDHVHHRDGGRSITFDRRRDRPALPPPPEQPWRAGASCKFAPRDEEAPPLAGASARLSPQEEEEEAAQPHEEAPPLAGASAPLAPQAASEKPKSGTDAVELLLHLEERDAKKKLEAKLAKVKEKIEAKAKLEEEKAKAKLEEEKAKAKLEEEKPKAKLEAEKGNAAGPPSAAGAKAATTALVAADAAPTAKGSGMARAAAKAKSAKAQTPAKEKPKPPLCHTPAKEPPSKSAAGTASKKAGVTANAASGGPKWRFDVERSISNLLVRVQKKDGKWKNKGFRWGPAEKGRMYANLEEAKAAAMKWVAAGFPSL